MMMWGYGWSGPGVLMMIVSSLLWIALIAALVWGAVYWLNKRNVNTTTPTPSAMEILRQRYARGEIDAATFEQMRERILSSTESETLREKQPF